MSEVRRGRKAGRQAGRWSGSGGGDCGVLGMRERGRAVSFFHLDLHSLTYLKT